MCYEFEWYWKAQSAEKQRKSRDVVQIEKRETPAPQPAKPERVETEKSPVTQQEAVPV